MTARKALGAPVRGDVETDWGWQYDTGVGITSTVAFSSPSLAELKAGVVITGPIPDRAPSAPPDNRPGGRARSGIGHLDFPWVGTVPNVGQSLRRLRAAGKSRQGRGASAAPVRVDVVPVIHQRAARGAWSARWSTAAVFGRRSHCTFVAPTTAGDVAPDNLVEASDIGAGRASRPSETPGLAPAPVTALTSRPTRGPNLRGWVPM
jgi:hypothetical protein